jgi:nucleoside-diphosphate-sugar epimerase
MPLPKKGYVVLSVPPGARAPAEETVLAGRLRADVRLIYLSTTGVYADADGGEVSDDYPLGPGSERAARRLAVETALQAVHGNHVCLRIPGIYGPRRGVHKRMQEGSYRLIGDGLSVVSRIHVDDLVCAIEVVARNAEITRCGVVVGDDAPCSTYEHAMGVAQRLGLPAPPQVDPMSVSADVRAMLSAGRRVVPATLKALGWRPQFPSWREGLEQCLAEESGPSAPETS